MNGTGIRACALFGLAALASAAPFSHRLHLKLKPDCTNCHTTVTHSTRAEDNNLPSAAVCKPCHENAAIPAPPKTLLAHFSHEKHLQLGNVAPIIAKAIDSGQYLSPAGDIRGHLNGTQRVPRVPPRHRDIGCGEPRRTCRKWPTAWFATTKSSCRSVARSCHGAGAKLRPADHPPEFLESHSRPDAKFDKTTCAVCHGRRFRCLGCH